jgi:hypothetical protein
MLLIHGKDNDFFIYDSNIVYGKSQTEWTGWGFLVVMVVDVTGWTGLTGWRFWW